MKIKNMSCKHVPIYDMIEFEFSFETEECEGFAMARIELCRSCFVALRGEIFQSVLNEMMEHIGFQVKMR